ncbi:hypothetical protein Dimus_038636 [Dionaea muscipula]
MSISVSEATNLHHVDQVCDALATSAQVGFAAPEVLTVSLPNSHSMVTRSKDGIQKKKQFEEYHCYSAMVADQNFGEYAFYCGFTTVQEVVDIVEPATYKIASKHSEWLQAMQEEIDALQSQGTWSLVPNPGDKNIVGCKWVYRIKRNPDGTVARYKARLVAQGFSQQPGLDFEETFSPVVRHTTVRVVLAIAASQSWKLRQLDIKNAFLHGDLREEVFMQQPKGFVDPTMPTHVCRLHKSLYGLKQAPRAWNEKFMSFLPAIGFQPSHSDPSLFVRSHSSTIVILLLYVDDIILTGNSDEALRFVIDELGSVFDLKDMGLLRYFLGLEIDYHPTGLFIHQSKYAVDHLQKAAMASCKSCSTPCSPHVYLSPLDGVPLENPSFYRSIVGSLQYLTFTRPDLAYAVNTACQFIQQPTDVHMGAVKRILRYIQGTLHQGLFFSSGPMRLLAYSDADWGGDPSTRRSTTGFVVFLGSNAVSWQSKKQPIVSKSSTEAEYRALVHTAADLFWLRQVLLALQVYLPHSPIICCDNLSAIALSSNAVFHSRIKYLDIDYHFIREKVQQKDLTLQYVPSDEQIADILTKGLSPRLFFQHCANLHLSCGPAAN